MNRLKTIGMMLLITLSTTAQEADSSRVVAALKTNMAVDAVLGLNLEAELPLDSLRRWTVMAEYWTPWYVWHHNSRAFEIQAGGLELRRWLSRDDERRRWLRGAFAGVYAAAGRYDLEWNSKGDQGEFLSAGLSGGWSWMLGSRFNLEASLALGALWGTRSHYIGKADDTHLVWQYDKRLFYVGPTKLKLSLVWLLTAKNKRKEVRP